MVRAMVKLAVSLAMLSTLFLAVQPLTVHAAAKLIQFNEGACFPFAVGHDCNSNSVDFPGDVTKGDVVVVAVGSRQDSVDIVPSVTDTRGTTLTRILTDYIAVGASGHLVVGIYVGIVVSGGPDTVTSLITSPYTPTENDLYIYDVSGVSGVATPGNYGQSWVGAVGAAHGTAVSTSSTLQFVAGSFLLGAIGTPCSDYKVPDTVITPGSGFYLSPQIEEGISGPAKCTSFHAQWAEIDPNPPHPTSPTNFPATLNTALDWVEVAIILYPTTSNSTTSTTSQTAMTDWAVVQIMIQPPQPMEGTPIRLGMTMSALSTTGVYPQRVAVRCIIDGSPCGSGRVTFPGPTGLSFTVSSDNLWVAIPGTHSLSWQIDATNDPNPSNNVMSITFTVQSSSTSQTMSTTTAQPSTTESSSSQVTVVQTETVTQEPTPTTSEAITQPGVLDIVQQNSLLLIGALVIAAIALAIALMRRGKHGPNATPSR